MNLLDLVKMKHSIMPLRQIMDENFMLGDETSSFP